MNMIYFFSFPLITACVTNRIKINQNRRQLECRTTRMQSLHKRNYHRLLLEAVHAHQWVGQQDLLDHH